MISFENDYSEGCAPEILAALARTNLEQLSGYGEDSYSLRAKEKIRAAIQTPKADIYFIGGGTETNQLAIDSMLEPWQGVLSAVTGHINVHEAGAIEFTGHKVLPLPAQQGKVNVADVKGYIDTFYGDASHEHEVFPGMLYISQPTEYGTLYSKSELEQLSACCRKNEIPLYIDGARLAYALASKENDVSLCDIARLADAFYIGGTKCGALIGEALVFPADNAPSHFLNRIKRHGDLLAKGRLTGIQFDTLFTDNLYCKLGEHGIAQAEKIKALFAKAGVQFFINSPTNQQFVVLENERLKKLAQQVKFSFWEKYDETHTVVRFASSWATSDSQIAQLESLIAN